MPGLPSCSATHTILANQRCHRAAGPLPYPVTLPEGPVGAGDIAHCFRHRNIYTAGCRCVHRRFPATVELTVMKHKAHLKGVLPGLDGYGDNLSRIP